jgi:hypothetical protein
MSMDHPGAEWGKAVSNPKETDMTRFDFDVISDTPERRSHPPQAEAERKPAVLPETEKEPAPQPAMRREAAA